MKKLSVLAMVAAFVMAPGIARADPDADKQDASPRVETRGSGQVITVGPDGKVQVRKFGDGEAAQGIAILEGERGDAAKKRAGERRGECEEKSAEKGEVRVFGSVKAFKIGPEGKMDELESLPKNLQDLIKRGGFGGGTVQGSITVVGLDGKTHTQTFGDGTLDVDSISKSIREALEGTGTELPEGLQGRLREALKNLPEALRRQVDDALPTEEDTIGQKLDDILRRLDKLEKEVHDLKASPQ